MINQEKNDQDDNQLIFESLEQHQNNQELLIENVGNPFKIDIDS